MCRIFRSFRKSYFFGSHAATDRSNPSLSSAQMAVSRYHLTYHWWAHEVFSELWDRYPSSSRFSSWRILILRKILQHSGPKFDVDPCGMISWISDSELIFDLVFPTWWALLMQCDHRVILRCRMNWFPYVSQALRHFSDRSSDIEILTFERYSDTDLSDL